MVERLDQVISELLERLPKDHPDRRFIEEEGIRVKKYLSLQEEAMAIVESGEINRAVFAQEIKLSPRQSETLGLMAKGYRNQEIADYLEKSLKTVEWTQRILYQKLRVHSGPQAVIKGVGIGIIKLDEAVEGLDISSINNLTETELDILRIMTENNGVNSGSNAQIAFLRGDKSPKTVDSQIASIMRKLGVRRIQAGLMYMKAMEKPESG